MWKPLISGSAGIHIRTIIYKHGIKAIQNLMVNLPISQVSAENLPSLRSRAGPWPNPNISDLDQPGKESI